MSAAQYHNKTLQNMCFTANLEHQLLDLKER